MDDIMMDSIPPTWPLVIQLYMVRTLYDGLYDLSGNPVSKIMTVFYSTFNEVRTFQMAPDVKKP